MKYWYGYPLHECQCGFTTPDEDEFSRHLLKKGHKPKEDPEARKKNTKAKSRKNAEMEDKNA